MSASFTKTQQRAAAIVLLVVGTLLAGATSGAKTPEADDDVKLIRTEKLANAPGQTLTVVTVNYAPGGKSRGHHHAGSVFAYVLFGRDPIREFRNRAGQGLQGRRKLL